MTEGAETDPQFVGGERFEFRRRLGQGGMGVVYEAFDHQRGIPVALKTLRDASPQGIFRFKQEFRVLAEFVHPNLVTLYDLLATGDQWFFTMELIEGVSFLTHVRPGDAAARNAPTREHPPQRLDASDNTDTTAPLAPGAVINSRAPTSPLSLVDVDRLITAARQLAEGMIALHDRGHLHRDIKPSNVMVTNEGRTVLLDFGVIHARPDYQSEFTQKGVVGTPAFMAPEQYRPDATLTPASDWYGFGLILYEALTGRRAFAGSNDEVLAAKLAEQFDRPSALVSTIPAALDELCMDLLRAPPEVRPNGRQVLARLAGRRAQSSPPFLLSSTPNAGGTALIGREPHLAALHRALAASAAKGVVAFVHGGSGMGKTALVERFLHEATSAAPVQVLAGRCYERESVPYRAVDGVIDALTRHLVGLTERDVEALMTRDVQALSRVFPVLQRVDAIAALPPRLADQDPMELRQRAFRAFRDILAGLAARSGLIVFVDDLQWGDRDSAGLLLELIRPPTPRGLMLLCSYRTQDAATSALLKSIEDWRARVGSAVEVVEVEVGALTADHAQRLAAALLGSELGPASSPHANTIASESQGSPFFVHELAEHARTGVAPGALGLDQAIVARVATLSASAQRLLEILAVAGRPIQQAVVVNAAGGGAGGTPLNLLRAGHLLRTPASGAQHQVECYHDRIREAVVASLPAARIMEHHAALARALETAGHRDPQALAVHLEGAGENERAGEVCLEAAQQAHQALAFERAAALYRRSLELRPREGLAAAAILIAAADCLSAGGRGTEASATYLRAVDAAAGQDGAREVVLRAQGRAAEDLLRAGHLEAGMEALAKVLASVGLALPRRPLLSLIGLRLRIALSGLRFRERTTPMSVDEQTRMDLCWSAAAVLGMSDNLRGAVLQARHLVEALRVGDPGHAALALCLECAFHSLKGPKTRPRVERISKAAQELAAKASHPLGRGFAIGALGLAEYQYGQYRSSVDHCQRGVQILRDECRAVWFQINTIEIFSLWSTALLGDMHVQSRRVFDLLREADARGDLYAVAGLCTSRNALAWLVRDDAAGARAAMQNAMKNWSPRGYHLQHYWAFIAEVNTHLYAGDAAAARRCVERDWKPLQSALFSRVHTIKLDALNGFGRAALAVADSGGNLTASLAEAARTAARLDKFDLPLALGCAALQRAGAARLQKRDDECVAQLRKAEPHFAAGELGLHLAVTRYRLGQVLGGSEGAALVADATGWMKEREIVRPERMAYLYAPGFGTG